MMDKTLKINIAGTLFQIDGEAFGILRDYLLAVNNRFRNIKGGHETIDDIELRIAEIFQSGRGMAGVITKDNVEAMISIIGKPEDFDISGEETVPPVFVAQNKRMYRNPDDSVISGVCGGLGAYLNTDPVLFRVLFVLFTAFYGVGFLIYIALWISLPPANNDARKKELYGNANYSSAYNDLQPETSRRYRGHSGLSNALNEIFRAIGRVVYIGLRIFLIIIGTTLVITGSLFIVCLVMIFIFKYPGSFSSGHADMNLNYFPDFLNYIVTPEVAPWIKILTVMALLIPCLAFIYWGVKMIFWFKANDGIYNLAGLVLWVITLTSLSILLFSEGVSFVETGKTTSQQVFPQPKGPLYLKSGNKVSDLSYDKELLFPDEGYNIMINDNKKELYIRPYLKVRESADGTYMLNLKKRSSGRSETEARKKTDELGYNYRLSGDTIFLDEYFTIPSGRKWAADNIGVNLYVPEGTVIKTDKESETLFHCHSSDEDGEDFYQAGTQGNSSWILTEDGLERE